MSENKRLNKREKKKLERERQKLFHEKYNISKMTKVNDDWYPTYPKHEVSVHLFISWFDFKDSGFVGLVIAGMDDYCVAKKYDSKDINELIEKWDEYKKIYDSIPQTTNKRWYLDRGFLPD